MLKSEYKFLEIITLTFWPLSDLDIWHNIFSRLCQLLIILSTNMCMWPIYYRYHRFGNIIGLNIIMLTLQNGGHLGNHLGFLISQDTSRSRHHVPEPIDIDVTHGSNNFCRCLGYIRKSLFWHIAQAAPVLNTPVGCFHGTLFDRASHC